ITLGLIQASRSLRQSHQVPMSKELPFTIWTSDPSLLGENGALQQSRDYLSHFTRAEGDIAFIDGSHSSLDIDTTGMVTHVISPELKLITSLASIQKAIAAAAEASASAANSRQSNTNSVTADRMKQEQELRRLDKKLNTVRADMEKLSIRVARPEYMDRVPENVRAADAKRKETLLAQEEHLLATMKTLRTALA
ncbi:hypothetical protein BGX28_009952, partial [Mortierella sp. GBA30]